MLTTAFLALRARQPALFSDATIPLPAATRDAMVELIAAIESVIARPAFQALALIDAPATARQPTAAQSVFMGYDFHLTPDGPKLIEINTNAGGGLLNACLLAGRGREDAAHRLASDILAMFREEWHHERGAAPLRRVAIVDEAPGEQFLAPEFELFRELFESAGIAASVNDPADFEIVHDRLVIQGEPVDLIYNRLTDFSLDAAVNAKIRRIFLEGGVVLTPHPRAHALYADKRNLVHLSDEATLMALGVEKEVRRRLLAGIPRTERVTPENAETFWAARKRWFFKPPAGFGSRAAYRGDKLTRRVFDEIRQGGYLAQEIAPPSEHPVPVGTETVAMKADFRCYVYGGALQLVAARLYQGQTTNFRTPGGGFALVV